MATVNKKNVEQITGGFRSRNTLLAQITSDMEPVNLIKGVANKYVKRPVFRAVNAIDHLIGTDVKRRDRWVATRGQNVVKVVYPSYLLHQTTLFNSLRQARKREYVLMGSKFWSLDHRAQWRSTRSEKFSTEPMYFNIYRIQATYAGNRYHNSHRTAMDVLACEDIVNFFVTNEKSDMTVKQIRDRCWKRWSQGHGFNVPVEIEFQVVRNSIEVALLMIMALNTVDDYLPNETIVEYDHCDGTHVLASDVYTPLARMMEDNKSSFESTMTEAVDGFQQQMSVSQLKPILLNQQPLPQFDRPVRSGHNQTSNPISNQNSPLSLQRQSGNLKEKPMPQSTVKRTEIHPRSVSRTRGRSPTRRLGKRVVSSSILRSPSSSPSGSVRFGFGDQIPDRDVDKRRPLVSPRSFVGDANK
jgi:hypothetical protein